LFWVGIVEKFELFPKRELERVGTTSFTNFTDDVAGWESECM
jgi:hypothetical protein